jgi:hypothetical protein
VLFNYCLEDEGNFFIFINSLGNIFWVSPNAAKLYINQANTGLATIEKGSFKPLPGIKKFDLRIRMICPYDSGRILIGTTSNGLFLCDGVTTVPFPTGADELIKENELLSGIRLSSVPNQFALASSKGGLFIIDSRGKLKYTFNKASGLADNSISDIFEDPGGNLWLGTRSSGVFKVDFSTGNTSPKITHFTGSHGLPSARDKGVNVSPAAGHVVFLTGKGLARFDEKENRFFPDNTLGYTFSLSLDNIFPLSLTLPVFRLIEDKYRNIWFHSASRNYRGILKPDGTYDIICRPFLRIPFTQVNCIYYDAGEDSAWFASINGLIRYDADTKKNSPDDFNALIRKVELINGKIPVFDGYREDTNLERIQREFAYKDRNIRFEFASPFFEDEKGTTYSYRLDGYDDNWVPFSTETRKDYTNLGPGTYTFRVRAQNVYGDLSKEGIYRFKVLAPWYETWGSRRINCLISSTGFTRQRPRMKSRKKVPASAWH